MRWLAYFVLGSDSKTWPYILMNTATDEVILTTKKYQNFYYFLRKMYVKGSH